MKVKRGFLLKGKIRLSGIVFLVFLFSTAGCFLRSHDIRRYIPSDRVSNLINKLKADDPRIRVEAALALQDSASPGEIESFIVALGDENPYVRYNARAALGRIGESAVKPLILTMKGQNLQLRWEAMLALKRTGATAVRPLIDLLQEDDPELRWSASLTLGWMGEVAVGTLVQALNSKDGEVRFWVVRALSDTGSGKALNALNSVLDDGEAEVKYIAAVALGETGDARAITALVQLLNDSSTKVRWGAELALKKAGSGVVPVLIDRLKDKDQDTRLRVTRILGEIGDKRAIEPLTGLLSDDVEVRASAAQALGKMRAYQVVPALIPLIKDSEVNVRRSVVRALGEIGDKRAVDPLIAALSDGEALVRANAAESLGKIKDPRAQIPLTSALRDQDYSVREEAADALGSLEPLAIKPLITALRDKDAQISAGAAIALVGNKDPKVKDLIVQAFPEINLRLVAKEYESFILRRVPGTETLLIAALSLYGQKDMAQDYLNCGSRLLEKAAIKWAISQDCHIEIERQYSGPIWGNEGK